MPSASDNTATPFSIFISYASGDRPAARLLGETLKKAGLDVWLDEEELAGGDAWDAKIRQQIRTCTYFMPVISATTEARREGYFRREWRLAVERTLDHADDVLFLTPVVIDETREQGARVPEKFMSVQWLRCPGGKETPQLAELARRLAAGPDAVPPAPPVSAAPPVMRAGKRATKREDGAKLPPFLPFPAFPESGHRLRFIYDLVVWCGRTIVALWYRLPRWLRWVAMIYIVFQVLGFVFGSREKKASREDRAEKAAAAKKISELFAQNAADKGKDDDTGVATAERVIAAVTKAASEALQVDRPLVLAKLKSGEAGTEQALSDAYEGISSRLQKAGHADDVANVTLSLPAGVDEKTILNQVAKYRSRWLLLGAAKSTGGDEFTVAIRLFDLSTQKLVWEAERTADSDSTKDVGEALGAELLKHVDFTLPPPEPVKPAAPPAGETAAPPAPAK